MSDHIPLYFLDMSWVTAVIPLAHPPHLELCQGFMLKLNIANLEISRLLTLNSVRLDLNCFCMGSGPRFHLDGLYSEQG